MEYKEVTTSIDGAWNFSKWEWKFESIALIGRTFEAMKEHKLLGNKCPDCGTVYFLPKPFCRCLGMPDEFVEVKDTGTITTYTVTGAWGYEGITEEEGAQGEPLIFAGVQFDGADTKVVCVVEDVEPEKVGVGMRVKLKWPDKLEGAITDLSRCTPL